MRNKFLILIFFAVLTRSSKADAFDCEYDLGISTFSYIEDKMSYYPNIGISFGANFVDNVRISVDAEYMQTSASSIWSAAASIIYKYINSANIQPYIGCKIGGFSNYTIYNSVSIAHMNAEKANYTKISKLERLIPKLTSSGYEVGVHTFGSGILGASINPVYNIDIFMNYEPTLWPNENLKYSIIHKFLIGFRYKF